MEDTLKFATAYLHTWLNALENDNLQMSSAWHNYHQWTVAHMANVLYPLAIKLDYGANNYGITMQQEYYRVDFSLYTYFEQSTWTLDYAIEHENAAFILNADGSIHEKGWFDEFAKLLPLKCAESRVIIGYDNFDGQFTAKLKMCENLLNDPRIQNSVTDSPILLILLPRNEYMKRKDYKSGLLQIVEFRKMNKTWQINELSKKICDDKAEKRLNAAYAKIIATSK